MLKKLIPICNIEKREAHVIKYHEEKQGQDIIIDTDTRRIIRSKKRLE